MKDRRFKDKKVAVLGFMMEGKALVKYLLGHKANITVFDRKKREELDFEGIDASRINLICGEKYLERGLKDYEVVFRSPGVYRYIPEIVEAEKKGVEISSEMKLFFDLCPAKIIGVTGTKGKGTTTTLIYEILKKSGKDVYLAGNIGITRLELLPKLRKVSWVVLELSSFQLIDMHKSPHIAVVLNIYQDHMDWHKDMGEYVNAKTNIVRHQDKDDFAVINFDYQTSRRFRQYTRAKIFYFSKKRMVKGAYVGESLKFRQKGVALKKKRRGPEEKIFIRVGKVQDEVGAIRNLKLRGKHNWENVTAAICAAKLAGADVTSIKKTVFSFKGLEHRLELVGKIKRAAFYNDSASTNPQTTIAAIKSLPESLTLILGGFDKKLEYKQLSEEIIKARNVRTVVLIGQIAKKIKKVLNQAKYKGKVLELEKSSMEKIVRTSFKNTPKNGVVLLSPATSSFDMFENYKDRGDQFRSAVQGLKRNSRK